MIRGLCRSRNIPVMINMHDVEQAKRFADRIIGMSGGSVVYDGDRAGLSDEQPKATYGGKDRLQQ